MLQFNKYSNHKILQYKVSSVKYRFKSEHGNLSESTKKLLLYLLTI